MPTLNWIGKEKVVNHHLEVAVRELKRTYSFDGSGPHEADGGGENKIIHGDSLDNSDSKRKLELGRAWQNATNSHFKYFMVFKDRDVQLEGAYQLGEFLEVLKGL